MLLQHVILGTLYITQTGVGILGNSILLSFFIFTRCKLRPIDQIISNLILGNFIFLFSKGIPMTISAFGMIGFMDDTGCKLDLYFQRVARGLSICSTSLLSGFQVIILTPINSQSKEIKTRAPKYITFSCVFCWLFNLFIEIGIAIGTKGLQKNTNFTAPIDLIFCTWKFPVQNFVLLSTFRDVFFVGMMICTSIYIVILLRKHSQQVKHLQRTRRYARVSPEFRAARTILLTVSTFISFYLVNGLFAMYQNYFLHSSTWLVNVSSFLVLSFPTISPFLLIHGDSQMGRAFCAS
ncbi:vomeronasal 1 receptor monDomV1R1280 [Monodelphis domestica]|uniref:vomeronasal 1 receptor monDomV1R1280 n=1 Tax=Monodelphis domestica TaxID=13616 RepID=UPI0000F2E1C2|nr:vomeronasal 1 receptor monDomV1R1280 [Monodelphis domestica]